jgi:N-acetylglutamate synthase-like GNAT family acetyltransferase
MNLKFKPLNIDNLVLLYNWFQEPIVNAFYAQGKTWTLDDIKQKYLPRILNEDNVPSFIIELDMKPVGFIQYYNLNDHLPEGIEANSCLFASIPRSKCAGVDIFLADTSIRGKNIAPHIINEFISSHCAHFDALVVDPETTNLQAIYCYTKAGFLRTRWSVNETNVILIKTRRNHSIHLDLLSNHPDVIPQLANIWLEVLGKIWVPQVSFTDVVTRLKTHLNSQSLPLCIVAFDGEKPIGCAALRVTDGIRPELTPWLASLIVDPAYQRRNIGRLLIDAIKQKARYLGFETLYLLTFDATLPDFYERIGFKNIGADTLLGLPVTVMGLANRFST